MHAWIMDAHNLIPCFLGLDGFLQNYTNDIPIVCGSLNWNKILRRMQPECISVRMHIEMLLIGFRVECNHPVPSIHFNVFYMYAYSKQSNNFIEYLLNALAQTRHCRLNGWWGTRTEDWLSPIVKYLYSDKCLPIRKAQYCKRNVKLRMLVGSIKCWALVQRDRMNFGGKQTQTTFCIIILNHWAKF